MTEALLTARDLKAYYDESQALHGVGFDVHEGEIVCLLGRNGAGKSTILRSVMGLQRRRTGSIHLRGQEIINVAPERIARAGVGFCPENRGIFATLTVEENLTLPPIVQTGGMSDAEVFDLFPNLAERRHARGSSLSGGEQQMLAIARILRSGASLLLLDEPTEGLAPVIVKAIGRVMTAIKARGYSVVLVEQNYRFATKFADRIHIIADGKVAESFDPRIEPESINKIKYYLSV